MSRRIRTIKPEILDDDKTASLSHVAWRLFVSALSLSDDHGNLRAGVTYLMGQVFHSSPNTDREDVERAVDELAETGLWQVYTVRGQTYAHIRGWAKHQRIDNAGKPRVPGPNEADGTTPISAEAKNKVRGESRRVAASRGESPRVAAVRGGSRLDHDQDQDHEGTRTRSESAGAGAPAHARVYAHEETPPTSPTPAVLATVVSTEPTPSRQPLPPVEVAPSSPRAETPPSCPAAAPLAASDAGDDDQPPPAQRCPSTPNPEPVPVEAAPVAPAVASPSPVAAPSGQTSLLTDEPAGDEPEPVAIPKVSALTPSTPANRILRAWGEVMFQAHHQPLATESRRRAVRDRLKTFTEDDLLRALRSAITDPYVNGQSDRAPTGGQRDIAWLFAKVERVEGFLRNAPTPAVTTPAAPRPIRLPPPPKPGEVRATITREEFERSAFAAIRAPRHTPAEVDALLGLEAHHAS